MEMQPRTSTLAASPRGLSVPQTAVKRRRPGTSTIDPQYAESPNHVWNYNFVADQTSDGKTLRFLTVYWGASMILVLMLCASSAHVISRRTIWFACSISSLNFTALRRL